jgi:hypothetical protein
VRGRAVTAEEEEADLSGIDGSGDRLERHR